MDCFRFGKKKKSVSAERDYRGAGAVALLWRTAAGACIYGCAGSLFPYSRHHDSHGAAVYKLCRLWLYQRRRIFELFRFPGCSIPGICRNIQDPGGSIRVGNGAGDASLLSADDGSYPGRFSGAGAGSGQCRSRVDSTQLCRGQHRRLYKEVSRIFFDAAGAAADLFSA